MARRLVAVLASVVVQLWSLAPVAASVIYCIGEDGHSGFELVHAGQRGCAACCHGEESGEVQFETTAASECTDIALAPASGVSVKLASITASVPASSLLALDPTNDRRFLDGRRRSEIPFDPPRGSATRLQRLTVLLI